MFRRARFTTRLGSVIDLSGPQLKPDNILVPNFGFFTQELNVGGCVFSCAAAVAVIAGARLY